MNSLLSSMVIAAAIFGIVALPASASADPRKQPSASARPTAAAKQERARIEATTRAAMSRPMVVTSRHRDNSEAHKRGAIDISSKNLSSAQRHAEARALSKALGPRRTVVVEEVHAAPRHYGPEAQRNTAYRNGVQGNSKLGPVRASATHTHIQPDAPRASRGAGRAEPVRAGGSRATGQRSSVRASGASHRSRR